MSSRTIVSTLCVVPVWGGAAEGSAAGQSSRGGPAASGASSSSSLGGWNAGDETTVGGVIREVLAKKPDGAPAGLNFVMTGSQHALTVSIGGNLDPKFRDLLRAGETVRVTGVVRSIGGQDYLLARELVVGGQTIQVRSSNGLPVRMRPSGGASPKHAESDLNGGAR
jgi:hypothetical protein